MRRTRKTLRCKRKMTELFLILLIALTAVLGVQTALADDTDVYQATVRNNALLMIDLSNSMGLPVYNHNFDYNAFIEWAEGEEAVSIFDGYGAIPYKDAEGNMLWEKNKIYLVSFPAEHLEITDEDGNSHAMVHDPLWDGGVDNGIQEEMIENGILDTGWTITDWDDPASGNTIETDENGYVVYPTFPDPNGNGIHMPVDQDAGDGEDDLDPIYPTSPLYATWYNTLNGGSLSGERLSNHQDILLTDLTTDDETGVTRDYGLAGYLETAGIYFSGLFRAPQYASDPNYLDFSDNHFVTDDPDQAYKSGGVGDPWMYAFVTGNYLSFLKLVEDLEGTGTASCTTDSDWRSICYQPGSGWLIGQDPNIRSHGQNHQTWFDYQTHGHGAIGPGYTQKGVIDPEGIIGSIQIRFEFIDMDSCGSDPDFVEFRKADDETVVLRIKGQEYTGGTTGADGGYMLDNSDPTNPNNWTQLGLLDQMLDSEGYFIEELSDLNTDKLYVYFFNGATGDDQCCDDDAGCCGWYTSGCSDQQIYASRGFHINGYKYATEGGGGFECCNGPDGVGYKIESRLEIAQDAMTNVVEATGEELNWGLAVYPDPDGDQYSGAPLITDFDEGPDQVIADIQTLDHYGGTPTGEAMERGYNYFDTYLEAHPDTAICSNNYMLLMTDGFPNWDEDWTLVSSNDSGNPDFSGDQYNDGDTWGWQHGSTTGDEHADDVAGWMAGWPSSQPVASGGEASEFEINTHTIGFSFDNAILQDIAEDGAGYAITAYSRDQLISAFFQLGLTMSSTVSFVAPVVSVDEANRTESGDKVYMAFFRPEDDNYWKGNLKKYGLDWITREECGRSEPEWTVVDQNGNIATDCNGSILNSATSFWSSLADGVAVDSGGAGGMLMNAIDAVDIVNGPYYDFRNIYTCDSSNNLIAFTPANIDDDDLEVADEDVNKVINFMYGYTYNADGNGDPVAKRTWILGDVIHSEPQIIEYFDPDQGLTHRYIAVGANDGMLHVFTDTDCTIDGTAYSAGEEVFAFIPSDLLTELKNFEDTDHFYTVDGSPNLWRGGVLDEDDDDTWDSGEYYEKILVFGERRGGHSYWALELSDPDPAEWSVRWHIERGDDYFHALGQTWNKPQFARIRTGEDSFKDLVVFAGGYDPLEDQFPEPFTDDEDNPNGVYDPATEVYSDLNTNGNYDKHNLNGVDDMGRAIYVVDISDGSHVQSRDRWDSGYSHMDWCFPADPTVIPISENKLLIYAPDIYGQIWRMSYNYRSGQDFDDNWSAYRIFNANPGSDLETGSPDIDLAGADTSDTGRKMFYGPDVSYFGNCWTRRPVLYFGTGDREHPNYAMTSNRFYAVQDAYGIYDITEETDLLNLTCNELEDETVPDLDGDGDGDADDIAIQDQLKDILKNGDARGWYRILDEQGDCISGMHDHTGEKLLSRPTLFFGNLYFSTYQPTFDDPCNANGNALVYALDYCWGTSVFDLYSENVGRDIRDTYQLLSTGSIPSGVRVITRSGEAAGIISAAGAVSGVGEDESTNIPEPPSGVTRMLWETD